MSYIPIIYTTASGEPLLSPTHGFAWNLHCTNRDQVQPASEQGTMMSPGSQPTAVLSTVVTLPAFPKLFLQLLFHPGHRTNQTTLLKEPGTLPQAVSASAVVEKINRCDNFHPLPRRSLGVGMVMGMRVVPLLPGLVCSCLWWVGSGFCLQPCCCLPSYHCTCTAAW